MNLMVLRIVSFLLDQPDLLCELFTVCVIEVGKNVVLMFEWSVTFACRSPALQPYRNEDVTITSYQIMLSGCIKEEEPPRSTLQIKPKETSHF